MGKEIKISLAVIAVLLGAMGYALYRQFAPAIGDQPTGDPVAEGTQAPGSESSTEAEQGLVAAESTRPTFVAATPGVPDDTGTASPSTDPWAAVSSSPASRGLESPRSGSSGFSYMPQAVPAAPAGRYATGYGGETSGAAVSDSWSTDQGTASTQPGYDSYRTYASQSTTPGYSSSATPSAGSGGSMYQSPSVSTGVSRQNPAAGQTGYQGYQNPASPAGSASGTSGTSATGNWSSSAGYSGTSESPGASNRQGSFSDQDGSATSGASDQSSGSYGVNQGSGYNTSGSYAHSSFPTTTPATSSPNTYSAGSTSTYAAGSTSTYGSNATATTTGQSSTDYSSSTRQDSFGQGSYGRSTPAQKKVIETPAQEGKYLIQPNDSFWTISQRLYGTGAFFRALAEHNRSKNPDTHQLRVGDEIDAPSASTLEASYPQLCPKPSHREAIEHRASVAGTVPQPSGSNVYTVQAGDTLFDIARYELGKASRWVEIYQLNRERLGKDFDYLTPGLKLAMPADASSETVTQQPAASFRR